MHDIINSYNILKTRFKGNEIDLKVSESLESIHLKCEDFLSTFTKDNLTSQVANKEYFAFKTPENKHSRCINKILYETGKNHIVSFWDAVKTNDYSRMTADDITASCYRIAISFCSSIDLLKDNDQKTPGTYFECLIGHLYSRFFDVKPSQQLDVLNIGMSSKLPTDFIFDLGENKPKFHVPIKTSTRERVIQVWAHQRVLDGVYGTGRFIGLLTCLSETKLDHSALSVVEICLPSQWRIYQLFIAQMKRIYYLDIPHKYSVLNNAFPKIHVLQFGEFFKEANALE